MFSFDGLKNFAADEFKDRITQTLGNLKIIGFLIFCGSVYIIIKEQDLGIGIPSLAIGAGLFGLSVILKKVIEKTAVKIHEKKLTSDLNFAIEEVRKNPEIKTYMMSVNSAYRDYVLNSEI